MLSENLAKFGKSRLKTPIHPLTGVPSTPLPLDYPIEEELVPRRQPPPPPSEDQ